MRLIRSFVLIFALIVHITCFSQAKQINKPNIILILADDLGYTGLSSFGSNYYVTPHIDRLAREGMIFTNGYAAATVCAPSRATVLSGQYTPRTGVFRVTDQQRRGSSLENYEFLQPENRKFAAEINTLAEAMKRGAYVTGMYGKWHLFPATPGDQGFDYWLESHGKHFGFQTTPARNVPEGSYLSDYMTEQTIRFITENRDTSFFLYLPEFLVHKPLEAKEEIIKKYRNKRPDGNQKDPVYAAMTESLDYSVGRIYRTLEELGLLENTLIIFTSDNGANARTDPEGKTYLDRGVSDNAPLRDGKGLMYEGGLRVPWIFYWKGKVEASAVCQEPIHGVDLYPTLISLGKIDKLEDKILDGVDIKELLLGNKEYLESRALYWHYPNYGPARARNGKISYSSIPADVIRFGNFKLIEYYHDTTLRLELFNLEKDPGEQHDLSQESEEKTQELFSKLQDWKKSIGATYPIPNPAYRQAQ